VTNISFALQRLSPSIAIVGFHVIIEPRTLAGEGVDDTKTAPGGSVSMIVALVGAKYPTSLISHVAFGHTLILY
jgi:hypothetical protein